MHAGERPRPGVFAFVKGIPRAIRCVWTSKGRSTHHGSPLCDSAAFLNRFRERSPGTPTRIHHRQADVHTRPLEHVFLYHSNGIDSPPFGENLVWNTNIWCCRNFRQYCAVLYWSLGQRRRRSVANKVE